MSFYVLALGIAGILLWIPYEAYANDVRLPIKLALICIGSVAAIIWSVLPRIDRFVAPGPELTASGAPELFSVLTEVAARTGQQMPADVYLVNDVNAFVTQRGGVMGVGSRRVMGIGLPLMQAVTVQELKAILAHEFGHYHSGDVKIGPWIHKTRAAIGRTIEKLSDSYLQKVFVAYGNLFLRVTHAISRRQEFIADEVAANAGGAAGMASALRKAHGYAAAFNGYWSAWDDVVETVFVPIWRAQVKGNDRLLAGITSPARLPCAGRLTVIAGQFDAAEPPVLDQVQVVTMALSLALLDAGWRGTTSPGEEIVFRRNELEVRPFDELMAVAAGKVSAEQWAARCAELGIERVVLRAGRS